MGVRRARMTIAERAMEGDLHLALQSKNYREISTLYFEQGADLIAGALHAEGEILVTHSFVSSSPYTEPTSVAFLFAIHRGIKHVAQFHEGSWCRSRFVNQQDPYEQTALIIAS